MRRLTVKLLIAMLTFIIGVSAATSRLFFGENQKRGSAPALLPYCEVARNPEPYHGKVIRTRATLSFGSEGMYIVEECDPVEALASVVELEGSEGASSKAHNYVKEMLTDQTEVQIEKMDVVVVGRFDGEHSAGCWAPKYRIAATNIQKFSP